MHTCERRPRARVADPEDSQATLRMLDELFECILRRRGIALKINLAAAGAKDTSNRGDAFRRIIRAMQTGC